MAGRKRVLVASVLGFLLSPVILLSRPGGAPADQQRGGDQHGNSGVYGGSTKPPPSIPDAVEEPDSRRSTRPPIPFSPEPRKLDDQGHLEPLAQDKDEIERRARVRISVAPRPFRILEPIRIYLWVRNTSEHTMILSKSHIPHRVFEVQARRDSSGREVSRTRHFLKLSHFATGSQPHELRPGEEGMYILVANVVYDMTEADEYTLSVKVPFQTIESFDELPLARRCWMAESAPVKVRVAPFDADLDGGP